MEKKDDSNASITFALCIGNEVFVKDSFLAYRPRSTDTFTVFKIPFVCVNLIGLPFLGEPVIGEIIGPYPKQKCRDILIENSFMQLSKEDAEEIRNLCSSALVA